MANHRGQRRPLACAVVTLAAIGCAGDPGNSGEIDTRNEGAAATEVRRISVSCDGFRDALRRLDRASGRVLTGLVGDAIEAARPACPDLLAVAGGRSAAQQLARSLLRDEHPHPALVELHTSWEPAVRFRRAELFDRMQRYDEALLEIDVAMALAPDAQGLVLRRSIEVAA